jgi:hypothetical protein
MSCLEDLPGMKKKRPYMRFIIRRDLLRNLGEKVWWGGMNWINLA